MKRQILLLAITAAALSSCTTAYKTGQTPDDVYFSPTRPQDEYVRVEEKEEPRYDEYNYDDRYLRMKVHNRSRWSDLDDIYFYNPRYSYTSYNNWNNPWSPYTYWNYYYNPYCGGNYIITNPKTTVAYNLPRIFNLNTYNSNNLLSASSYLNPKANNTSNNKPVRIFGSSNNNSNSNSNSNAGSMLRNIFGSSNNNSSSSGSSGSSSSGSSTKSSSSGSSGSSGSSAPVRKF